MTLALLKVNSIGNYRTMIRPELGILGKCTAVGMFPSLSIPQGPRWWSVCLATGHVTWLTYLRFLYCKVAVLPFVHNILGEKLGDEVTTCFVREF